MGPVAEMGGLEPSALDHAAARLTSLVFQLADAAGVSDPAQAVDAAASAAPAKNNSGWLGPLTDALEEILKFLEAGLEKLNVPYPSGFAIVLLTVLVKVVP